MARATRATWAERVRRWKRSGLSARAFAERHGLKPKTLWWWAWRLERGRSMAVEHPRAAFVEVVAKSEAPMVPSSSSPSALEVLVDGARVVVPAGFDEETLLRVVRVLESR